MSKEFEIPEIQKAIVFNKVGGPLEYKDIPVPKPKGDELLVHILYSGVCHSDLHIWKGDLEFPLSLPLVGGHEGVGIVVDMGKDVKGWEIGDYAGVKLINRTCMTCELCRTAREHSCPHVIWSGCTCNGSFEQYATITAFQAPKIPKDCDLAEAAPIMCAGVTVYSGLKNANIKAGEWICIIGACGGLGTLAIQYAKAMGYRIIGIDSGEGREELFYKLEGEIFIDYKKEDNIIEKIKELTNGGVHAAINLTFSNSAIEQAIQYVRPYGNVVLVGLPSGDYKVNTADQILRSINIIGSYFGNTEDTNEALDFFARGLVKSPIKIVPMSTLSEVYDKFIKGEVIGRYVLDTSK